MRRLSIIAAMVIVAVMTGCATTEGYQQRVDLLTGASADQLLVDWGTPLAKGKLTDGSEVWLYENVWTSYSSASWSTDVDVTTEKFKDSEGKEHKRTRTVSKPSYSPEKATEHRCETRFVIAPDGRVKSANFNGNCRAREITKKRD